ncbi:MAG: hypothetical protein IIZ63_18855 [Caulobacteraceae bacterium]|nr:hypothetical protein [Caulobacteraceae bacterium]
MTLRSHIAPLLAAAAALVAPLPAHCDGWDAVAPVGDEVLSQQRGGFLVADGIAFDFGAVMRTFVGGQLALETTLTWTPTGPVTQQTAFGGAMPATLADIQTALTNAGLGSTSVTGQNSYLLNAGQTVLIQNASNGAVQNLLLNTASNQVITQDLAVTLTLPNSAAFQGAINTQQLGFALNAAGTAAAIGALHR